VSVAGVWCRLIPDVLIDEAAVKTKFGVGPESIVDYLALVGDSADGFPGLPGWGAKSASTLLAKYGDIMSIPLDHATWITDGVKVRGAEKLATVLREGRADAELFRILAKLVDTVEVGAVDDWQWGGPSSKFDALAKGWQIPKLGERARVCASAD